jgi:hypothetical protein
MIGASLEYLTAKEAHTAFLPPHYGSKRNKHASQSRWMSQKWESFIHGARPCLIGAGILFFSSTQWTSTLMPGRFFSWGHGTRGGWDSGRGPLLQSIISGCQTFYTEENDTAQKGGGRPKVPGPPYRKKHKNLLPDVLFRNYKTRAAISKSWELRWQQRVRRWSWPRPGSPCGHSGLPGGWIWVNLRWGDKQANRRPLPKFTFGRGSQSDVVSHGWPIAPSYMSPNAGGGVSANEYSCAQSHGAQIILGHISIFNLWVLASYCNSTWRVPCHLFILFARLSYTILLAEFKSMYAYVVSLSPTLFFLCETGSLYCLLNWLYCQFAALIYWRKATSWRPVYVDS